MGVPEMQGDPALMGRAGRPSPCEPCGGRGTLEPPRGWQVTGDAGFHIPCPRSGQSPEAALLLPAETARLPARSRRPCFPPAQAPGWCWSHSRCLLVRMRHALAWGSALPNGPGSVE